MARCNFSIGFSQSAQDLVNKATNAIKQAGGEFNGDTNNGTFSLSTPIGAVNGSYIIENSLINIQVDNKPVFLSCTRIQTELQNYLTEI